MATSRRSRSDLRSGQARSRTALNAPSRPQRATSLHSVHSVASTSQVRLQLFREAFNFIDQDGDQIISKGMNVCRRACFENLSSMICSNRSRSWKTAADLVALAKVVFDIYERSAQQVKYVNKAGDERAAL